MHLTVILIFVCSFAAQIPGNFGELNEKFQKCFETYKEQYPMSQQIKEECGAKYKDTKDPNEFLEKRNKCWDETEKAIPEMKIFQEACTIGNFSGEEVQVQEFLDAIADFWESQD